MSGGERAQLSGGDRSEASGALAVPFLARLY